MTNGYTDLKKVTTFISGGQIESQPTNPFAMIFQTLDAFAPHNVFVSVFQGMGCGVEGGRGHGGAGGRTIIRESPKERAVARATRRKVRDIQRQSGIQVF